MRFNKICKNCNKEYITYYEQSKYCSNKCLKELEGLKEKKCPVCKNKFKPINIKQIHCNIECYSKSEKLKEEAKNSHLINNNGQWKGNLGNIKEDVGSSALHEWIRRYKPKSDVCEICKSNTQSGILDAANISGEYKRDINDFIWLCRSCHTKFDRIKKKYIVIGIESKKGKYLDATEKKMVQWYKENKIFSDIYVAYPNKTSKQKNKKGIVYTKVG
jgi:hypothetical protein